jgi:hypothetical protein
MQLKSLPVCGAVILFVLLIGRLTLGVDLTDESFYLATAFSIIKWGAFIVDKSIAQTAPMLEIPFIFLWQNLSQGFGGGLMLFLRVVFLALSLLSCTVLFTYAKTRLSFTCAMMVALLPLVWIPYGLPALSYNTLGENFFLIGLLLCCAEPSDKKLLLLKVATFAIACFAYPTLTAAVTLFLILRICVSGGTREKIAQSRIILFLAIVAVSVAAALILLCKWENIAEAISYFQLYAKGYSSEKLLWLSTQLTGAYFPQLATVSVVLGILTAINSRTARKTKLAVLLVLTSIMFVVAEWLPTSLYIHSNTQICLLAIFLLPIFIDYRIGYRHIPLVTRLAVISSYLAGFMTALSSANGFMASSIGLYPAICLGFCELGAISKRSNNKKVLASYLALLTTVLVVLTHSSLTFIYGDTDSLGARIPGGVFKWLRTTPAKRELLQGLAADLKKCSDGAKTIYIIGPPGLYFCSDLKALDMSLFHVSGAGFKEIRPIFARNLKSHGTPDIIVKTDDASFGIPNSLDLELLGSGQYKQCVHSLHYTIFKRAGGLSTANPMPVFP